MTLLQVSPGSGVSAARGRSKELPVGGGAPPLTAAAPSAEQLAAITAPLDAPVRVLAGPGAGKTYVIARRYAYLLEQGAQPEAIVAVTYSKDMAEALVQRIARVSPTLEQQPEALEQICTIHALCYRMLKKSGDRRQLPADWKVRSALKTLAQAWPEAQRPAWQLLGQWLRWSKMDGKAEPEELRAYFSRFLGEAQGGRVAAARARFDEALRAQNLLTFDDMLLDVERRLLFDHAFRARWQARYKWLIVDEAQDTSAQAMRILSLLAWPENQVFVVGDADQTLFRFAGGAPEHNLYEGFEQRFPGGQMLKLTTNYRSTAAIVAAQLRLIRHNYHEQGGRYADQYLKELHPRPEAPAGAPVTFCLYATPEAEAEAVAQRIQQSVRQGRRPSDFFIGARARSQLAYIEGALAAEGLPYINIAGNSFWLLSHVQDVVAYLALACAPGDAEAFKRVYNIPSAAMRGPRYLGAAFLQACGGQLGGVAAAAAQNAQWQRGADDLLGLVRQIGQALKAEGLAAGVRLILDTCYYDYLQREALAVDVSGDSAADDRLGELEVLAEIAGHFGSADELVAYARRMRNLADRADQRHRIVVSTIHRLKGQERPVVYGVGWSEGVDEKKRPLGLLPHTYSLRDSSPAALADERCVAFVLLSRAQEACHLSGVRLNRGAKLGASRFAVEAGLAGADRFLQPGEAAEMDADEETDAEASDAGRV